MCKVLIFALSTVLCSQVTGRGIPELETDIPDVANLRTDSMLLKLPKKIENAQKLEMFVMVLNITIVYGKTLTMTLPVGDRKNVCKTKFHFSKTAINIETNDSDIDEDLKNYQLLENKTKLELRLQQASFNQNLVLIYVRGQDNSNQHVDSCNIQDITKINHVLLEGGFSQLNSMRFEFEQL